MKKSLLSIFAMAAALAAATTASATSVSGNFSISYEVATPAGFDNHIGLNQTFTTIGLSGGSASGGTGIFTSIVSANPSGVSQCGMTPACLTQYSSTVVSSSPTSSAAATLNTTTGLTTPLYFYDPYTEYYICGVTLCQTSGNGAIGYFTETTAPFETTQSATTDTFYLLGTFTGTGVFTGDTNTMSILLSVTNNNGNISANGPSAVPAAALTPEPGSLVLLGTGMMSAAGLLRRRMRA